VTVMFGLGVATLLTMVVVPTLYATFYGIREA
jgi:multidrug efflux pump subunit AcrB